MHTIRKTNEQIFWEEKHLLRQLKFFAKSHNESKKCIITAINQWTLTGFTDSWKGLATQKVLIIIRHGQEILTVPSELFKSLWFLQTP